ncbi:MAG TPA: amidohydrolase [Hyphomonadaceae bacterium]|nr:amidohydrolase [Hyphomonadaceae bacterium]
MRLGLPGWSLIGLSVLALSACQPAAKTPAPDAVFYHATIYTGLDGAAPVEAVSVKDGHILATGKSEDLLKTADDKTQKIDLGGTFLYPGFTDAHAHLMGIGEREMNLNLDKVGSVAELVSVVGEAAKAKAPGQVLQGRGWIETHWPEKRFPNRHDLDAVTGDHPTILTRADGHALVANTAALKAVGIDGKPKSQPDGGRIELGKDGLPTGMLIDNAMRLLASLNTAPTPEYIDEAYEKGAAREIGLGWTGVHSMSVDGKLVPRINALSDAGKLNLRIYNAVDGQDFDQLVANKVFGETKDLMVITKAIKLYMDGALGSRGALLEEPYSDQPDTSGLERSHEAETLAIMKKAYDAGIQVCVHAIGDKGNRQTLDWMEKTFKTDPNYATADKRWRIEHSQILRLEDIPRFKQLRIIPSMQPSHAIGDLYFAPSRLGPRRLGGAYAWKSLIEAGSIIAGGSDAPVEQGDPRIEFYAAVARKDLKGNRGPDEEWHPEQAVTRAEALKMFTIWPAYASFREKELGTIEPGKLADFTGFSADIMTIPEAEILTVNPEITVVGGKVVFHRAS